MPRNGAGTFSVINPIVVGALRSSSAVNQNAVDAGDEITNSLPLTGTVEMLGQFKAFDGTVTFPGISFGSDTNTGFRRSAVDESRWVAGGVDRATMDVEGKLTLAGGLSVAGALSQLTGSFGPQTMAATGAAAIGLKNTSNDTSEHELASFEVGSGAGAKGSLRVVGGGANDVSLMRFYVNNVLAFQWSGTLFTHSTDVLFGANGVRADTDGFLDFPQISAPSAPNANIARMYVKDSGGLPRPFYKDNGGTEYQVFDALVDRQVFTSSGTWTKPTAGQTLALLEMWGAGGGGGDPVGANFFGGGGGGGYNAKLLILASVSASVVVSVGVGGGTNTAGGNSTFGAYLTAFAGGGGIGTGGTETGSSGGGGGGLNSAGATAGAFEHNAGAGGGPISTTGAFLWGAGAGLNNANPFGGGGGSGGGTQGVGLWGGGGGGGQNGGGGSTPGANAIFGGGGGAGQLNTAGTSLFGGNGGTNSTAATAPGGGGGPARVGARGEVRITCW